MMAASMSTASPRHRAASAPPLERVVIEGCRAQDPFAFRAFIVRHERMVFALLSRMLGHGPEVEDLAQETFLRAYRAFPTFDPDGPALVSTWLLTIATRLALDSRKRRRLDTTPLDGGSSPALEGVSTAATPEQALEQQRLGIALAEAAATLPDDQRAALILAELHGLSIAEIAMAVETPENTVKTRLFRARTKMRELLSGWLGGADGKPS